MQKTYRKKDEHQNFELPRPHTYLTEQADHRYEVTSKVFQTTEKVQKEITVPLPDRTLFYYATTNPVKDSQGNVILALFHSVDITARKKAEEELSHNAAAICINVVDPVGYAKNKGWYLTKN